jgi:hypothetical protein
VGGNTQPPSPQSVADYRNFLKRAAARIGQSLAAASLAARIISANGRSNGSLTLALMFGGSMGPWEALPAAPKRGRRARLGLAGLGSDGEERVTSLTSAPLIGEDHGGERPRKIIGTIRWPIRGPDVVPPDWVNA